MLPACRIAVYDDFNVQFNETASKKTVMEWPPYSRNTTAKLQYGHAAVIVGYDNTNYTWTVLNSCEEQWIAQLV
jgi:C1A family cysteine protease